MLSPLVVCLLLGVAGGDSLAHPAPARRDHGPGTSGGGIATQSGETLKPGAFALTLRLDYTQFERLSSADIQEKTFKVDDDHAHFDAVRWSLLETVELSYGAAEGFQVSYSFGYYRANDLREGHLHADGSYGFHEFGDVSGMTDHWLSAKLRLLSGPEGHFSIFSGIKLPFGDDDEVGEDGTRNEPLEPSLQPGSGAFDAILGVAYSRWLSENVTLDTSLQYTRRTEEDDFKIGDLLLFGAAVAYRFTENVQTFPQVSVFLETNVRFLFRNREGAHEVENSGGTVLFVSPGIRVGLSDRAALTVSPQMPVVQDLNDEQQETLFKVAMALTFAF
jgi:hypothetical protein